MKKLLAILITLALLLCALPALTEGYDDALDAAFEAGRVKFTQANYPLPDLATCEIVAPPDELWQFAGIEPMDEAQMRAVLTQAELTVFSYAPDGQSGIGLLAVGGERGFAEVLVGEESCFAATGGAFDETFFDEIGFIDILDGTGIFTHGGRDCIEADRSAAELIDDGKQQFIVDLIKTEGIDIECFEGVLGDLEIDGTVTFDLGEVTYAAK